MNEGGPDFTAYSRQPKKSSLPLSVAFPTDRLHDTTTHSHLVGPAAVIWIEVLATGWLI